MSLSTWFVMATAVLLCLQCFVTAKIVHLSDIHMDPFFGTRNAVGSCKTSSVPFYGQPGCDTSRKMAQLAIQSACRSVESPNDIVLFTGDWVRHDTSRLQNATQVMSEIVHELSAMIADSCNLTSGRVFAHPKIALPTIGNEDLFPDYHLNVSTNVHPLLNSYSKSFMNFDLMTSEESATFNHCGYFSRILSDTVLLSLNTVIYDNEHSPTTKNSDPCGQIAWLRMILENARLHNHTVVVAAHVPPSAALYIPTYYPPLKKLFVEFADIIQGLFFGHTHRFYFVAIADDHAPPGIVGGPITQVSHTNPNFAVHTTQGRSILETTQFPFNVDLQKFVEGKRLTQVLNIDSITVRNLYLAGGELLHNATMFKSFYTMYEGDGKVIKPCVGSCAKFIACNTFALNITEAGACVFG